MFAFLLQNSAFPFRIFEKDSHMCEEKKSDLISPELYLLSIMLHMIAHFFSAVCIINNTISREWSVIIARSCEQMHSNMVRLFPYVVNYAVRNRASGKSERTSLFSARVQRMRDKLSRTRLNAIRLNVIVWDHRCCAADNNNSPTFTHR